MATTTLSTSTLAAPNPLKVLFAAHHHFDTLDLTGPMEVLWHFAYTAARPSPVFSVSVVSGTEITSSEQGLKVVRDISLEEGFATLGDYDVLVIPGGDSEGVLANSSSPSSPIALIRAFTALPPRENGQTRTLLSICTGALFLAAAGVLDGKTATTHPDYAFRLHDLVALSGKQTEVVEQRFVVNESKEKGGLRIVTGGGVSSGIDAALWLGELMAGREMREVVERMVQYSYRNEGVVL